jgi:type VI secretion system secreted protein VgrG
LISERLDLDPTEILGKAVSITLHPRTKSDSLLGAAASALLGGGPSDRYFHGIVTAFRAGAAVVDVQGGEGGFRAYTADVVPKFGLLEFATNCRIFQEKTVVEILEAVLKEHGFSAGQDYSVSDVSGPLTSRKWDYCVQYNETDFQFLSRLIEQVGIYYYFVHEESAHKIVFTDQASLDVDSHDLIFKTASTLTDEDNQITSWEHRHVFAAGKLAVTDFDFRNSATDLLATATTSAGHADTKNFELFRYPRPYQTSKLDAYGTKSDGTKMAELDMQVLDAQRHVIAGSSNDRELMPAHHIEIEHERLGDEDGEKYLLISVRHEMQQEVVPTEGNFGALGYANTFLCIPEDVPYRPPQVTSKPRMQGPQTAIVIGAKALDAKSKADQEVMTDKYGRVKVQFHWDRRLGQGEKKYENSSCWIRVSQGHAGAGFGMMFLPRKGEEVLVDFLEGDPDQPIITGRVYNAQNTVPWVLDDKQKKDNIYFSGYKSRSSLEGDVAKNFNELRFEDKKEKERIYFHAERDFVRVVENKDILIVSDKKQITDDRVDKVTKETKDGSQTIEIYKNRTVNILTGDEKFTVDEGNRTVTVKKGDDHHEVSKGHRTSKISKGDDKIEVSEGDRIVEIKKGEHKLDVAKDVTVTSGKNVSITAKNTKIELVVGQSSITMKNDGTITIKGKTITLDAMQGITIKAMQKIDIKALQKVDIEGTLGTTIKGLQVDAKGTVKAALNGSVMAEVTGGAMTKVKGGVTFVG